ncbi:MAG: hypothetical protein GDA41_06305 [Rhodospirillales bacterium]|nr:hypothetical protein [Rhodospirillales bacterium]
MTTSGATYGNAVLLFRKGLEAVRAEPPKSARALARRIGAKPTSMQRYVDALEVEGFLARGNDGQIVPGHATRQLGLAARGLGPLTVAAEPILTRLRQATGCTAFLAEIEERRLLIGPYSIGRPIRAHTIFSHYDLDHRPDAETVECHTLRLAEPGPEGRRRMASVVALSSDPASGQVAGVFLPGHGERMPAVTEALLSARDIVRDAIGHGP